MFTVAKGTMSERRYTISMIYIKNTLKSLNGTTFLFKQLHPLLFFQTKNNNKKQQKNEPNKNS